jgi:hypothetical protein
MKMNEYIVEIIIIINVICKVVRFLTLSLFERAFEPSLPFEHAFEPSLLFERTFEPSLPFERAFEPSLPFERTFEPSLPSRARL